MTRFGAQSCCVCCRLPSRVVANMCRQRRADNRRKLMKFSSAKIAMAGLALGVALSGCVVTARPVVPVGVVYAAPPPPPPEPVVGIAPGPGYFWVGGAYFFEGGRYVWHPGRWMAPRAGYHWVPHAWVHAGGGWHMQEGHWARG